MYGAQTSLLLERALLSYQARPGNRFSGHVPWRHWSLNTKKNIEVAKVAYFYHLLMTCVQYFVCMNVACRRQRWFWTVKIEIPEVTPSWRQLVDVVSCRLLAIFALIFQNGGARWSCPKRARCWRRLGRSSVVFGTRRAFGLLGGSSWTFAEVGSGSVQDAWLRAGKSRWGRRWVVGNFARFKFAAPRQNRW